MCIEIEAKLKVDSFEQIKTRLEELGAEFIEEQVQEDNYFDNAESGLRAADSCLRLRLQKAGNREKAFLTYKGCREKGQFKRRKEIELEIQDSESIAKLLAAIGYRKVLVFEKNRQLWRLDKCDVALDQLPQLGSFVEIEGPDESEIADVKQKLGLQDLPHIPESYAQLMSNKLQQ